MPVPVMDLANTDTEPKYQNANYRANTGIGHKCKYANTGTGTI